MNNTRRNEIRRIKEQLEDIVSRLEELIDEEQTAFDNLPESIQGSEKGEAMEEAIYNLESAKDDVENITYNLEEVL